MEALSKAGILDRVMEVVNEVDEDDISSAGDKASKNGSRRSSMAPSISETTNQQVQPPTFMVTSATVPDLAKQAESQPVIPNATIETMPASDAPERQKQTGREKETVAPPKQEELPLNTVCAALAESSILLTSTSEGATCSYVSRPHSKERKWWHRRQHNYGHECKVGLCQPYSRL